MTQSDTVLVDLDAGVLTLTLKNAGRFNLRRDWNSLLSLTGRHLVWPVAVPAPAPAWAPAVLESGPCCGVVWVVCGIMELPPPALPPCWAKARTGRAMSPAAAVMASSCWRVVMGGVTSSTGKPGGGRVVPGERHEP